MDNIKLKMRLDKLNKGVNLVNSQKEYVKPYKIEIMLEATMNLMETKVGLQIYHNLDIDNKYGYEKNFRNFLNNLKSWCEKPIYFPTSYNRERNGNSWTISGTFKQEKISPAEIEITVYPEAAKAIQSKYKISDLKAEITKMLESQRYATKDEMKDFGRWIYLLEKQDDLKELHKSSCNDNDYGYCSQENPDKTIKAGIISTKEYNNSLKKVENEMKELKQKYGWLNVPRIEYKEEVKKPSFKSWKEENESDLTNEWDSLEEPATKEFKSYNDFCKYQFKVWLDANSEAFDE